MPKVSSILQVSPDHHFKGLLPPIQPTGVTIEYEDENGDIKRETLTQQELERRPNYIQATSATGVTIEYEDENGDIKRETLTQQELERRPNYKLKKD